MNESMLNAHFSQGGNERSARKAAVACVIAALLLWVGPAVLRVDIFDGDAAHHVFWLYQYADPSLLPNDVTVRYLRTSAPLGYRALYSMVAPLGDVLLATKIISGFLLAASAWLAWRAVRAIDSPDGARRGLFAVVAVCLLVALGQQTGGILPPLAFQRTFALPLVLLCVWALISRRYVWAGISWVTSALFYPVMIPVLGLTSALVFLRDLWVERRMPKDWIANALLGATAIGLALFAIPKAPELGPMISYEQAVHSAEFGPFGRLKLYVDGFSAGWLRFHMTGLGWSQYVLLALAVAVGIVLMRRHKLLPFAAWALLATGVGLWLFMRLFPDLTMFELYLPNRHSRWAIAGFAVIAFSGAAYLALEWVQRGRVGHLVHDAAVWAAPALVTIALLPVAIGQVRSPVDSDLESTYAFLETLPKDTLVAAHPTLANFIPLRAHRSVLASTETSMPWMIEYYRMMKPRVEASLRAAYATDLAEADRLLEPYGVDIFVTGPSVWEMQRYHEPYNSEFVQDLLREGKQRGFALRHPPPDRVLFRSGDYYVISMPGTDLRKE
jgi:hypothetical protein